MKARFNRWWLLPFGILATSVMLALSIVVFEPSFVERSFAVVAQRAPSGAVVDCSGAFSSDFSCYQKRYEALVRDFGVKAAFADLKDEYEKNEFVKTNCHPMTHEIGRVALDLYGDLATTYSYGDGFCEGGYYHGAIEIVAAKVGPDKIREEANTLCADVSENQKYSSYHYNCVHGLGHGFMGILDNEVFKSLETCDTLADDWERESCYGGVFMENVADEDNPSRPAKYLKADQPLYPCTEVETKYKNPCYQIQITHALRTQNNDFAKVFDLCSRVEDDSRPPCYQGLGRDAAGQNITEVAQTGSTCALGEDYEARSNCAFGAVRYFIYYYNSDAQAKEFCESLDADLHDACLKEAEDYYKGFQA